MGILFSCSHCSKRLNVKTHQAGEQGFCPKCGGAIVVPEQSTIEPNLVKKRKKRKPVDIDSQLVDVNSNIHQQHSNRDETQETGNTGSRSSLTTDGSPTESRDIALLPDDWKALGVEGQDETFLLGKPENKSIQGDASSVIQSGLNKVWYVRHPRFGETGPVKGNKISAMLQQKKIERGSLIWREDWSDWERAEKVFSDLLPAGDDESSPDHSKVFSDPNHPIPRNSMKQFLETQARRRRQLITVVAIAVGIATIAGLIALLIHIF